MAIADIITVATYTGGQFLSSITVGGRQFFDSTVNLLTVFTQAVFNGLTK